MTITQECATKTCPKCKHTETEYISKTQKCDYCGKIEKYPCKSEQYTSDFYGIKIFPVNSGSEEVKDRTFCSPEHMVMFVAHYRKPFGFITLPYLSMNKKTETRRGYLTLRDIRRLFKN